MVCVRLFGDDNRLNSLTADCTLPYFVTQSEVGAYDTAGLANSAVVSGTLAYVADGAGGLQIVDISTPASPRLVGSLAAVSSARGIDLALYPLATTAAAQGSGGAGAQGNRGAGRGDANAPNPNGRPIVTTPTPSAPTSRSGGKPLPAPAALRHPERSAAQSKDVGMPGRSEPAGARAWDGAPLGLAGSACSSGHARWCGRRSPQHASTGRDLEFARIRRRHRHLAHLRGTWRRVRQGRNAVGSGDGRYVAFESFASNLVQQRHERCYRHLRARHGRRHDPAGVGCAGRPNADNASYNPAISADGCHVVFTSIASNLVADDTNERLDVFLYHCEDGAIERVSVDSDEAEATGGDSTSYNAAISADGRYVVFESNATNLVSGGSDSIADVYLRDTVAGATSRVFVNAEGGSITDSQPYPSISANGRCIGFRSGATDLVPGDTTWYWNDTRSFTIGCQGRSTGHPFRSRAPRATRRPPTSRLPPTTTAMPVGHVHVVFR